MEQQFMWAGDQASEPNLVDYLPTYDSCFVCGQQHPGGLHIRYFARPEGSVHAWFEPVRTHTGYEDIVHGGVISALLHELIGWTVSLRNDLMAYMAELTVRFVKPVRLGRKYFASAQLGDGRGKCWRAEGTLCDEDGQLFAKGRGTYFLLSREETSAVAQKMTYFAGDLPAFRRKA